MHKELLPNSLNSLNSVDMLVRLRDTTDTRNTTYFRPRQHTDISSDKRMAAVLPAPESLWIARHGEAANSIDGRYGGAGDFPLTLRGQQQAANLAIHSARVGIRHILASPLLRAMQTAEIVAAGSQECEIHIIDELQEWNSYGVLSALRPSEACKLFPEIMRAVKGQPENPGVTILGAESRTEFRSRIARAVQDCLAIASRVHPQSCLLIGHGKFLRELATSVLHVTGKMSYDSAVLYKLTYQPPRAHLQFLPSSKLDSTQGKERTMKIYLVRHGEAEDDIDDSYGGAADHPLTEKGEAQAHELAATLNASRIARVYSSPLRRAARTAEIIATKIKLSDAVCIIDDLRERNSYGVLSGIPKKKAWDLFPLILRPGEIRSGSSKDALLGSEDFQSFVARTAAVFAFIAGEASHESLDSIAVVTHGTFLRVLLTEHLGLTLPEDWKHGSAMLLEYSPATAAIIQP